LACPAAAIFLPNEAEGYCAIGGNQVYLDSPDLHICEPEVSHSVSSNAKVKNEWRCTSPSPACLYGMDMEDSTLPFTTSIQDVVKP